MDITCILCGGPQDLGLWVEAWGLLGLINIGDQLSLTEFEGQYNIYRIINLNTIFCNINRSGFGES
jgi:hypothetical protein